MTDEMELKQLDRTGKPPLRFTGRCIGASTSTSRSPDTRGTNISIYETKGGKYVGHIERWTLWQGEEGNDQAESFENFSDLIGWLKKGSCTGTLGRTSQKAVEEAIRTKPELEEFWVEEVE